MSEHASASTLEPCTLNWAPTRTGTRQRVSSVLTRTFRYNSLAYAKDIFLGSSNVAKHRANRYACQAIRA